MTEPDEDEDEANGEETYSGGSCSRWGREIVRLDRWSTGRLHCSECGRSTTVVKGERRHTVEVDQ